MIASAARGDSVAGNVATTTRKRGQVVQRWSRQFPPAIRAAVVEQSQNLTPLTRRQGIGASSALQPLTRDSMLRHTVRIGSLPSANAVADWVRIDVIAEPAHDRQPQPIAHPIHSILGKYGLTMLQVERACLRLVLSLLERASRTSPTSKARPTIVGTSKASARIRNEFNERLGLIAPRAHSGLIWRWGWPTGHIQGIALAARPLIGRRALFAGVPRVLPASECAERLGHRALSAGTRLARLILQTETPFGMPSPRRSLRAGAFGGQILSGV